MTAIVAKIMLAGLPLAAAAALLGCMIQWRGMSFAGDALAHSALLGVGLALVIGVDWRVGVGAIALLMALHLHAGRGGGRLSADAVLAVSAHASLAAGACLLYLRRSSVDWESILFGSILTVRTVEAVGLLLASGLIVVAGALLWRRLVLLALNDEIASIENPRPALLELCFLLLLALYVTVGVRIVGVMLLNAMLIIPVAAARPLAHSPAGMALLAAAIGMASMAAGTALSFAADLPVAPATALAACGAFVLTWGWDALRRRPAGK
ncbi:MAG: metal ABC transporter permease [Betaproteobacteria bacterium AqS2]|uniref:High-affinity zinc uptake system membrane protein ZnuB n=1 Tax=Candidatus Amphirhobacter heronislandensis TaxID=1732024 RepID=A0A930UGI4_9GAMM|nr:metal ABC transporter permease [Betaproteobacteria bacterium AqS2]